jgi:hypothetical protein
MPQAKKPAMTSGPGALSRRTDGGPASKQAQRYISGMPNYGDGQELANLQASAPMAQGQNAKPMPQAAIAAAAQQGAQPSAMPQPTQGPQAIPLDVPTQFPNEPVTNGSPSGPGAGPEALILPKPTDQRQQEVSALVARYLPDLQAATNIPGVPDSYRKFVNYLTKQAQ